MHIRAKHPEVANAAINVDRKKLQWSEEEVRRLAHSEAGLVIKGVRFINQELLALHPERSLEAIKGKRRLATYRSLVEELVKARRDSPPNDDDQDSSSSSDDGPSTPTPHRDSVAVDPDEASTSGVSDQMPDHAASTGPSPSRTFEEAEAFRQLSVYLTTLPPSVGAFGEIDKVIASRESMSSSAILAELEAILRVVFPPPQTGHTTLRKGPRTRNTEVISRRKRRRAEYARVQSGYKKDRSRQIKSTLSGEGEPFRVTRGFAEDFWKSLLTQPASRLPPLPAVKYRGPCCSLRTLWAPINYDEIKKSFPRNSSAAGPDKVTPRMLRALPWEFLVKLLNLFLWCGELPGALLKARTVLIPKKSNITSPGELRPITISNGLSRLFTKILSTRIKDSLELDPRQRGFQPIDGCMQNSTILDLILVSRRESVRGVHMASVDLQKAFDSIAHEALLGVLEYAELPALFVKLVHSMYLQAGTVLQYSDGCSDLIHPTRGVRQGDPLSPLLFNLGIDVLLKSLPDHLGVPIGGKLVNAAAFADDLLLFAETERGLQELLNVTIQVLHSLGLKVNFSKSFTLSIVPSGRDKKVKVVEHPFLVGGAPLRSLRVGEEFEYLGVTFSTNGRAKVTVVDELRKKLEYLTKAPYKPQQRLFALRCYLLPGVYHKLVLGKTNLGHLRRADILVRRYVRQWLDLPHDVPVGYFHADIKDGGLGVPSLRWAMPRLRVSRLKRFLVIYTNCLPAGGDLGKDIINLQISRWKHSMMYQGSPVDTKAREHRMWASRLYEAVDGRALAAANLVPTSHKWISDGTSMLSGRNFIHCIKARINALPARSRTSRGRPQYERVCRAGCSAQETPNHIVQQCFRTHAARVKRHDHLVSYLQRSLEQRGFEVALEPVYRLSSGVLKPDVVATKDGAATIIDAQIVGDNVNLGEAHMQKVTKYSSHALLSSVRSLTGVSQIRVTSCTLNWRGIWSQHSADELHRFGILGGKDLKVMAARVLQATYNCFSRYMCMTALSGVMQRTGVG